MVYRYEFYYLIRWLNSLKILSKYPLPPNQHILSRLKLALFFRYFDFLKSFSFSVMV